MSAGERRLIGGPAVKKLLINSSCLSVRPSQTPWLIYLPIYLLPPPTNPNTGPQKPSERFSAERRRAQGREGWRERGRKKERKGGEPEEGEETGNLCSVGINKALSN